MHCACASCKAQCMPSFAGPKGGCTCVSMGLFADVAAPFDDYQGIIDSRLVLLSPVKE